MNEIKSYDSGEFCWTSLATSDVPAAKKFYGSLFGWDVEDVPMGSGEDLYTLFKTHGRDACAMHPLMEDQRKLNVPPHWMAFVSTSDVDTTAKKVKSAGGKILAEPMDVMTVGRMAMIQDPTGAILAAWQPREHIGAEIGGVPGTVCWRELYTPNVDVASKFYQTVFGWKPGDVMEVGGGMKYHLFSLGEEGVCGMMVPPDKNVPPSWLTYFIVESCKDSESKAKKLGGHIVKAVTPIPEMGCFSILTDPQGAPFGIFEAKC